MTGKRRATTLGESASPTGDARERILRTAYDLFSRHGVQAVGVDRIVAESDVAKTTLYRHFGSKDELVVAVLERRDERWSRGWLQSEVESRGGPAEARLLAIFDVLGEWFRRADYEGCLFAKTLLEASERKSLPGRASVEALARVRDWLADLAGEAGARDPTTFAAQWQILMLGSILAATAGDREAAARASELASLFLEQEARST